MPLSSSGADRRIPEALSTSRERNLTVEAPGWSALEPVTAAHDRLLCRIEIQRAVAEGIAGVRPEASVYRTSYFPSPIWFMKSWLSQISHS